MTELFLPLPAPSRFFCCERAARLSGHTVVVQGTVFRGVPFPEHFHLPSEDWSTARVCKTWVGKTKCNRTAGRQPLVGGVRGGDKGVFFPLWVKSFHLKVSNVPLTALFRSFPFQVSSSFPLSCEMEHEDDRLDSLRCLLWWAAGWRSGALWVAWLAFPSWALGSTVARPWS